MFLKPKKVTGKPPLKQNEELQKLGKPHVESFNFMINKGLNLAVADLHPIEFELPDSTRIKLYFESVDFGHPQIPPGTVSIGDRRIFPAECRQAASTYRGRFIGNFQYTIGSKHGTFTKDLGEIPIMLRSDLCHLNKLTPSELVKRGEHENEWGGYFIVKGHERLIRMLIQSRKNYPIVIKRTGWKMRGTLFTEFGVHIRCVKDDQTVTNNVLHYLSDGAMKLMISHRKALFYIPVMLILKGLCNYVDLHIFKKLVRGFEDNSSYVGIMKHALRSLHENFQIHTHQDCKAYIGKMFRVKLIECPPWESDEQVANFLFNNCVLIHLKNHEDKFNMLVFMIQKLYYFSQGKCQVEGSDSVMMQELMLGGHLYLQILKEKLQTWLYGWKYNLLQKLGKSSTVTHADILHAAKRAGGLENIMENFLATGNMERSALVLPQTKGLTVVPENINRMRYMSHFKAVHRGNFFQEMRTTEARQLLPDAWGFICPIHTPDGAPCGLLNHLTQTCEITDYPDQEKVKKIPIVMTQIGMIDVQSSDFQDLRDTYTVQLDGKIVGYVRSKRAAKFVETLRQIKIEGIEIPNTLEIVLIPMGEITPQYPGIYLFSGPARMVRPVLHLATGKMEYIGTLEQVYLHICVKLEEAYKGLTTHMEPSLLSFMSNLAMMIPLPDCNQSPRNMYQCQMGKQTMGTACHNWAQQADTKLYRLQTPQSPIFRNEHYDTLEMDDFAMGTNAIVAVISYTGYDMEDAVILNKASVERGLMHGSIYSTQFIELDQPSSYFCRDPKDPKLIDDLDADGLPYVGRTMTYGSPLFCYYNVDTSKYLVKKFKRKEDCFVDNVKRIGDLNSKACRKASVTYRIPRNPSVGDKFASRAGQKGICSQLWPPEDLPFSETGMQPDIIFNPHGFPSRMTIAMMIELMAGKSGACHGFFHDATPYRFNEKDTAIDYYGRLLEAAGYNYYGSECLYSGIDGRMIKAEIFQGVCYYQRLRHMVSDKWQVRSTGPMDILTKQPIKGRKRGGAIRFGEMERDSLISHGASFLLRDRLLLCSDKETVPVCSKCGLLFTYPIYNQEKKHKCQLCDTSKHIVYMDIPYIFDVISTSLVPFIKVYQKVKEIDNK